MLFRKKRRAAVTAPDSMGGINLDANELSNRLEDSVDIFKQIFKGDDTAMFRDFVNRDDAGVRCCAVFVDGMVNVLTINESIILPIMESRALHPGTSLVDEIMLKAISGNEAKKSSSVAELTSAVIYGDTVVLMDGHAEALIINSKGFSVRSISEPDDEKSLHGPREGFTEALMTNISMVRRKLQTSDLKFKMRSFGTRSNTRACLAYLDSLVDKHILADLEARLDKICIDGVLDVNYLNELIRDSPYSLYRTIGETEKPDIVAGKLLEGRIAIMLDGTPMTLTVPFIFIENFHTVGDYYSSFHYASLGRLFGIAAYLLTISLPALYVSVTAFNLELIPSTVLLGLTSAIKGVPLPVSIECITMILIYEILQEAGIRMPDKIGQSLSIVGALILGQAAVEAKHVSQPMVVIVAVTGIMGLMLPRLKEAIFYLRIISVIAAAIMGIYGFYLVMTANMVYLFTMQSFSVPFMSQMFSHRAREQGDIYIRAPFQFMRFRPRGIARDSVREVKR